MDEEEAKQQEKIHEALSTVLQEQGVIDPDQMLVGWVVGYEVVTSNGDSPLAGHVYGPRGMTTWRALGVIEWMRRFGLQPDNEDD